MKALKIGDTVKKKSGKPFKNGSMLQIITALGINEQDPNKRPCAIFSDGSVCNIDMLEESFVKLSQTSGFLNVVKSKGSKFNFCSDVTLIEKKGLVYFLPEDNSYRVIINDLSNLSYGDLSDSVCIIKEFLKRIADKNIPGIEVKETISEVIDNKEFTVRYDNGVIIIKN